MDRVRFGRALGYGARHAAKAMLAAADAATARNPAEPATTAAEASRARPASRPSPVTAARVAAVSSHAALSGRGMVQSVKRFSGAVLLQVIGTFFALFAVSFATGAWKMRAAFQLPGSSPEAHRLYALLLMCAIFSYFTVSSFLRARKVERS